MKLTITMDLTGYEPSLKEHKEQEDHEQNELFCNNVKQMIHTCLHKIVKYGYKCEVAYNLNYAITGIYKLED